jgi:LacI family transcriptional regulator
MTVSNVLTGRISSASEATRKRVLEQIERLGYLPHASARRLRLERRSAFGMLILDGAPDYLRDPFTTNIVAGLSNFATQRFQSVVLQGIHPQMAAQAPLVSQIETDALCLLLSGAAEERKAFLKRIRPIQQPIVLLQEHRPTDIDDACVIHQDDYAGGLAIARHLCRPGIPPPRRIMMLRPLVDWSAMLERERGLRAGLPEDTEVILVHSVDEGHEATQQALKAAISRCGPPDIIVGGNDAMALAGMKLMTAKGFSVPDDVRITGFNGFDVWRYSSPELTTVLSPAYQLGWRAGEEILKRLSIGHFTEPEIIFPVELQPGGTS